MVVYSPYATYPESYAVEAAKVIEAKEIAEAQVAEMSIAPELVEAEVRRLTEEAYKEMGEPPEPSVGVMTTGLPYDPTGRLTVQQYQEKLRQEELARQQAEEAMRVAALPPEITQVTVPIIEEPVIPEITTEELKGMLETFKEKRVTTERIEEIPGEIIETERLITEQVGDIAKGEEQIGTIEGMITEVKEAPDITWTIEGKQKSRAETIDYLSKQQASLEEMQRLVRISPPEATWRLQGKEVGGKEAQAFLKEALKDVKKSKKEVKAASDITWDINSEKGLTRSETVTYLKYQKAQTKKAIASMKEVVKEGEKYLGELPGYEAELKRYESALWAVEYEKKLPPGEIRKAPKYEPLSVSEAVYGAVARLAEPAIGLGMSPEMIATMAGMGMAALETTPILGAAIGEAGKALGVISPEARIGVFGAEEAPLTVGWALGVEAGPLWAQTPEAKFLGLLSEVGADILLGRAAAVTYKAGLKVAKKVMKVKRPITTRIAPQIYETTIGLAKRREAKIITKVEDIVSPEVRLMLSESIGYAEVPRFLRIGKKKVAIAAKAVGVAEEVTPELTRLRALGLAGEVGVEAPFVAAAELRKLRKPVEVLLEPLPEAIKVGEELIGKKVVKAVKLADYAQETAGFVQTGRKWEELLKPVKVKKLKPYYGLIGEYTPEARRFLEETTFGRLVPEVVKKIEPGSISKRTKKLITELYKKEFYTKKTYDSLIKAAKKIGDLPVDKVPRELGKIADRFERLKAYDEAIQLRRVVEGARAYLAEVSAVTAVKTLMEPTIIKPGIIPKPPKVVKPVVRVKEVPITMPTREGQLMLQRTIVKEKVRVEPLVKVRPRVEVKPKVKVRPMVEQLRFSEVMREQLRIEKVKPRVKVKVEPLRRTKELVEVSPLVKEIELVRVKVKVKPALKVRELELLKPSLELKEITKVKPPKPPVPIPRITRVRFPWRVPPPIIGRIAVPIKRRRVPIREELKPRYEYKPSITAVYERITTKEAIKQRIFTPMDIRPIIIKEKKERKKKLPIRRGIRDILKPSIRGKPSKVGVREALKQSIKF